MIEEELANKYSKALFDEARQSGLFDKFHAELEGIEQAFNKQKDIYSVLRHPGINMVQKKKFLEAIFKDIGLEDKIEALLYLLVTKKRLHLFRDIAKIYTDLTFGFEKKVLVDIESACSLSEKTQAYLRQLFSHRLGKKVQLRIRVDPELLGGLRIRIGTFIYDSSIKNNLHCFIGERPICT